MIRIEKFIILYCIIALINTLRFGYILDAHAFRIFDWYINNLSYALRILIFAMPLALGYSINGKIIWNNKHELWFHLLNRTLFTSIVILNLLTVFVDFSFLNKNYEFDLIVSVPKVTAIIVLLITNIYLIKAKNDY